MKIIRNEKLIKRNARIGQITMFGSLAILIGGMFISWRYPEQAVLSLILLIFGFLLAQVGIYFSNRWGRKPRPDELLDTGLKGFDNKYSLYHYSSPIAHLLVGPAGIWTLHPYHQSGSISYSNGRWRQKGGKLFLKIFAQENLGRPDLDVQGDLRKIVSYLEEQLPEDDALIVRSALVFTNPEVQINISEEDSPPAVTIPLKKLKDAIRKSAKGKSLSIEVVNRVNELLGGENSTN